MFVEVCFIFYFFSLLLFSFISNPMHYCGLLVLKSLISSVLCYAVFRFSWYSLLFCLVYIGGVYILFIFISVFRPKILVYSRSSFVYAILFVLVFLFAIIGIIMIYRRLPIEFSRTLCNLSEGKFYVCLCLTLVFGFILLRMIMCVKVNYYR